MTWAPCPHGVRTRGKKTPLLFLAVIESLPMRLASWIRFETAMTSDDWEGATSLLVSNLHRPDKELLCCKAVWQDSKLPPWKKRRLLLPKKL